MRFSCAVKIAGFLSALFLAFTSGCAGCSHKGSDCTDIKLNVTPLQGKEPLTARIDVTVESNPYYILGVRSADAPDWLYFQQVEQTKLGSSFSYSLTHTFTLSSNTLERDYPVVVTGVLANGKTCTFRKVVNVKKNIPPLISCADRQQVLSDTCPCLWQFNLSIYDDGNFGPVLFDSDGDGEFEYTTDVTGYTDSKKVEKTFEYCYFKKGIFFPAVRILDDGGGSDVDECQVVSCVCWFDYFGGFSISGYAVDVLPFSWNGKNYAVVNNATGGIWIIEVDSSGGIHPVSWIPGDPKDMVLHLYPKGPVLFLASGGLKMYDLSSPDSPISVPSKINVPVARLDVEDSPSGLTLVYLVENYDRMWICNVSDPWNFQGLTACNKVDLPTLVGTTSVVSPTDVAVFKKPPYQYVYVTYPGETASNMYLVAEVDPANLRVTQSSTAPLRGDSYPVEKIEISDEGGLLYAVEYQTCSSGICPYGLRIYNLANPMYPTKLSSSSCEFNNIYTLSGDFDHYYPKIAMDVYPYSDTMAFIAWKNHGWEGIYVDPATEGCWTNSKLTCFQLKQSQDNPNPVTCVIPPTGSGKAYGIAVTSIAGQEYVLTADLERGILVHKAGIQGAVFASHMDLGGSPIDFATYEPRSVVATAEGEAGVSLLDFSSVDETNRTPSVLSRIDVDGRVSDVEVTDNGYLYFTTDNMLYAYSITDPSNPQPIFSKSLTSPDCLFATSSGAEDLIAICVLNGSEYGLKFFKRSGTSITYVGETEPIFANGTLLTGNRNYVYAASSTDIYRFNLADLPGTILSDASSHTASGRPVFSAASSNDGQFVYFSTGYDLSVEVFDADLNLVNTFSADIGTNDDIRSLIYILSGGSRFLVASTSYEGVYIIDVSDPHDINISSASPPSYLRQVFYAGAVRVPYFNGFIYLTSDGTGEVNMYLDTCR